MTTLGMILIYIIYSVVSGILFAMTLDLTNRTQRRILLVLATPSIFLWVCTIIAAHDLKMTTKQLVNSFWYEE